MTTICLNMIVKNESHIISRCLEAVKDYIDYWVIVDTGSTDGTQDLIRQFMTGCPGELHERSWQDFEHNRNEALALARGKADYLLFVDADEIMHFTPLFDKNKLITDYYFTKTKAPGIEFYTAKLIKDDPYWRWTHVLHEFIQHEGDAEGEYLNEMWTESMQDGARSRDPHRCSKDIEILKQASQREPRNSRYVFYLAQSYFADRNLQLALETYEKRASMPGDRDETFWSMFCIGQLQEELKMAPEIYLKSYDRAHQFDPTRAEPLERIANYYFQNDCPSITYGIITYARTLPTPQPLTSGYYAWVYKFAVHSVTADCALALGKLQEAKEIYLKITKQAEGPKGLKDHAERQLKKIAQLKPQKKAVAV